MPLQYPLLDTCQINAGDDEDASSIHVFNNNSPFGQFAVEFALLVVQELALLERSHRIGIQPLYPLIPPVCDFLRFPSYRRTTAFQNRDVMRFTFGTNSGESINATHRRLKIRVVENLARFSTCQGCIGGCRIVVGCIDVPIFRLRPHVCTEGIACDWLAG